MIDEPIPEPSDEDCESESYDVAIGPPAHWCGLKKDHEPPHQCGACSEEWD